MDNIIHLRYSGDYNVLLFIYKTKPDKICHYQINVGNYDINEIFLALTIIFKAEKVDTNTIKISECSIEQFNDTIRCIQALISKGIRFTASTTTFEFLRHITELIYN